MMFLCFCRKDFRQWPTIYQADGNSLDHSPTKLKLCAVLDEGYVFKFSFSHLCSWSNTTFCSLLGFTLEQTFAWQFAYCDFKLAHGLIMHFALGLSDSQMSWRNILHPVFAHLCDYFCSLAMNLLREWHLFHTFNYCMLPTRKVHVASLYRSLSTLSVLLYVCTRIQLVKFTHNELTLLLFMFAIFLNTHFGLMIKILTVHIKAHIYALLCLMHITLFICKFTMSSDHMPTQYTTVVSWDW